MLRKVIGVLIIVCIILSAVYQHNKNREENSTETTENEVDAKIQDESSSGENDLFIRLKRLLEAPDHVAIAPGDVSYTARSFSDEEIQSLAKNYGYTAINVSREFGPQGALVLLAFGKQGLAIMRSNSKTFKELTKILGGEMAAKILIDYSNTPNFSNLIEKMEQFNPVTRELLHEEPILFPYSLLNENKVLEVWEKCSHEAVLYSFSSLPGDPESFELCSSLLLKNFLKDETSLNNNARIKWIKAGGFYGLYLAEKFPQVLDYYHYHNDSTPISLEPFLIILNTNQDDLSQLFENQEITCQELWRYFKAIQEKDNQLKTRPDTIETISEESEELYRPYQGDLICAASTDPHFLRLLHDKGDFQSLDLLTDLWIYGGSVIPSLLYNAYDDGDGNLDLFNHAWDALTNKNNNEPIYALDLLIEMQDYQENPSGNPNAGRFKYLLRLLDYRVVPYCLEKGITTDTCDKLAQRKKDELDEWSNSPSLLVQSIPGFDAYKLMTNLCKGYPPTMGEVVFGVVDVCTLPALGVGSLAKMGASGVVKTGVKEIAKVGAKSASKTTFKSVAKGYAMRTVKFFKSYEKDWVINYGSGEGFEKAIGFASNNMINKQTGEITPWGKKMINVMSKLDKTLNSSL